ncbi:hypothetical protein [Streptococcus pasteurianus]
MKTIKQVLLVLFSAILMVGMILAGMSSLKVDTSILEFQKLKFQKSWNNF